VSPLLLSQAQCGGFRRGCRLLFKKLVDASRIAIVAARLIVPAHKLVRFVTGERCYFAKLAAERTGKFSQDRTVAVEKMSGSRPIEPGAVIGDSKTECSIERGNNRQGKAAAA